jgi:hypothetical protein
VRQDRGHRAAPRAACLRVVMARAP